ncbi:MAG: hypothetical protein P4L46_09850 [Fimbriimonas sp.]|nr:hypothetical protein [Fimbriimonas sp.]
MNRKIWTAAFRKAFATTAAVAGIATMIVCSAGVANAQDGPPPPPQGQGGPGFGPMMGGPGMGMAQVHTAQLVNRRDVGKDLAITQDQRDQIREVMDRMREKMQSEMPPPDDGDRPDPDTMRKNMEKMQVEADKAIAKVLTTAQKTRLIEIKVQLNGPSAVLDKEIQDKVQLTDEQKTKVEEIAKANRPKMGRGGPGGGPGGPGGGGQGDDRGGPPDGGPGFGQGGPGGPGGPGGGGPSADMRAQMEKSKKALNDAIAAILSDDQKATLKKLAGTKKFVEQQRPMGGPDGGPGGPGGPGGGGFGGPGRGGPGGGQGGPGFGGFGN